MNGGKLQNQNLWLNMASGFKAYEKMFRKMPTPETAVLEGKAIDLDEDEGYEYVGNIHFMNRSCRLLTFAGFEGSYVISNAFSRSMQLELAQHCLFDCLQPENKTNLHGHTEKSVISSQMKDIWAREGILIDNLLGDPCPKLPKDTVLSKIRWVTLGHQYDWTLRKYAKDDFVHFPSKLAAICSEIGDLLGSKFSMKPDAAIVNFYPEGSVMGGHIDDAERTYEHPVISISIGCPCVFLLGGFDKDSDPIPIILKSGDVLIMGGKSRLRVHGVPKVFTKYLPPSYLHPNTAGMNMIHRSDCIHFLNSKKELVMPSSTRRDLSIGAEMNFLVNHSQVHSCKRNAPIDSIDDSNCSDPILSSNKRPKRIELDARSDNADDVVDGVENEDECISVQLSEATEVDQNLQITCKSCLPLLVEEEIRILRFLQTTRININVRQAYSDPTQTVV